MELDQERDRRWFEACLTEVIEKIGNVRLVVETPDDELDFPEEAILCPGRRILDDASQSFRHYDRAILVQGIPEKPF